MSMFTSERLLSTEKKRDPITEAVEFYAHQLERGNEIKPAEYISLEETSEVFDTFKTIHDQLETRSAELDPYWLLKNIQETSQLAQEVTNSSRALTGAQAMIEFSNPNFLEGAAIPYSYLPPDSIAEDKTMPSFYYDVVNRLYNSVCARHADFDYLIPEETKAVHRASVSLGNASYGRVVQRKAMGLLKQQMDGCEGEEKEHIRSLLFEAYISVDNKVRIQPRATLEEEYLVAEETLSYAWSLQQPDFQLSNNFESNLTEGRLGNIIRATHDVMSAALSFLKAGVPRDKIIPSLYANAATMGALTARTNPANPAYHNRVYDDEDHDRRLFLDRIDQHPSIVDQSTDTLPRISIPVADYYRPDYYDGEFPDYIFSSDPLLRQGQERIINQLRVNNSRCPVRYLFRSPRSVVENVRDHEESIKEIHGVETKLIRGESQRLNVAALSFTRVIQTGEQLGDGNLWSHVDEIMSA